MTLYITSLSFEERCLALIEDLEREGRESERQVAVLDFRGYEDVDPYLVNRAKFVQRVRRIGCSLEMVETTRSSSLACMARLADVVARAGRARVVVDISTLPRKFLFAVCRLLCDRNVDAKLRYYRPETYGGQLSRGVRGIESVPGFEGKGLGGGSTVLVLILGFEGYKSLYAWEQLGACRTVALLGDPPYRGEFLETARRRNGDLFRQLGSRGTVRGLHTFDVKAARRQLDAVYRGLIEEDRDVQVVLCPLGTKPQSVAAFALAYSNPDVGVAYVSSLMYYTNDYSRGFERDYAEVSLGALVAS